MSTPQLNEVRACLLPARTRRQEKRGQGPCLSSSPKSSAVDSKTLMPTSRSMGEFVRIGIVDHRAPCRPQGDQETFPADAAAKAPAKKAAAQAGRVRPPRAAGRAVDRPPRRLHRPPPRLRARRPLRPRRGPAAAPPRRPRLPPPRPPAAPAAAAPAPAPAAPRPAPARADVQPPVTAASTEPRRAGVPASRQRAASGAPRPAPRPGAPASGQQPVRARARAWHRP